jgi:hypothetical protein
MPTPTAAQIEGLATAALQAAGLRGEQAPGLAQAMAEVFAQALQLFAAQTQVLPGIPAAVAQSGSGSTTGPGRLLPPPAGGPGASQIEALAEAALQQAGLRGERIPDLAQVLGQVAETGLSLLCTQAMVAPGIPISGFSTSATGRLT